MHGFVRWVARHGLKWFYRDVVVVGAEHIPAEGPVLLIANHPNDLPDVLMGYLVAPREVHYVATLSAGTSLIARLVYRSLGVIPVTRVRDARRLLQQGADIVEVNRAAYRRVQEAWGRGELVGIFPEGGVSAGSDLAPFRPGAGQMISQCLDDGAVKAVSIVTIGYQYEGQFRPGSDIYLHVRPPLVMGSAEMQGGQQAAAVGVVSALTQQVKSVVRHATTPESRHEIDLIAATLGASLADHPHDALVTAGALAPLLSVAVRDDRDALRDAIAAARELRPLAHGLGAHCESARDLAELRWAVAGERPVHAPRTRLSSLQGASLPMVVATAPLALLGGVLHAPVFALVWTLAIRHAEGPEHRVARAFLPGIYIVLVWFLVVSGLVAFGLSLLGRSPWFALLMYPLFFFLGDLASEWRHALRLLRLRQRARRLPPAQQQTLRALFDRLHAFATSFAERSRMSRDRHDSVRVLA